MVGKILLSNVISPRGEVYSPVIGIPAWDSLPKNTVQQAAHDMISWNAVGALETTEQILCKISTIIRRQICCASLCLLAPSLCPKNLL